MKTMAIVTFAEGAGDFYYRQLRKLFTGVTITRYSFEGGPVDQPFTLEAGRNIWGYPKVMADFNLRGGKNFGFDVTIDGQFAVGMDFRPGFPVPAPSKPQQSPTYSHLDGITRETAGVWLPSGVR